MELELRKRAHLYDEGDRAWYNVFEYTAIDGSPTTVEVRCDQCDPGKLRQTLLARGAGLPQLDQCKDMLKRVVAEDAPKRRRASGNGWRLKEGDIAAFSSFHFVAERQGDGEYLPPADYGAVGQNISIEGTLEGWQSLVRVARYSTTMMVALCAVFAAPLLFLLNRPSFGLVLFGPSRAGKSTAQLVAASALGYGKEEELSTFKSTEAGLLDLGLMHNDHPLVLNEVGTASGPKDEVANALYAATYSLMTGQDKQRHRSWSGRREGGNTFKIIALASSELSPDEWAERQGQPRHPGETARMIAMPVVMAGEKSVFDMLPSSVARADAEAWDRAQYAALRDGLPHHRGVAYRDYVRQLVADPEKSLTAARDAVEFFEKKMLRDDLPPVQRDIVSKFGVLYAGGLLAIDLGILPLLKRELREAVETACWAAIAALPDEERTLIKNLKKLKVLLAGASIMNTARDARRLKNMSSADGFVEEHGGALSFTIRGVVLLKNFGRSGALELVRWLDDEGLLHHRKTRTAGSSIAWAETQVTWADGTRPRSVVINLPRGLDEFDRLLEPD